MSATPPPMRDTAHEQRAKNAPEQNPVLVSGRHAQVGEDEGDDKHVVHRQRKLNEVTGEKLHGGFASAERHESARKKLASANQAVSSQAPP